MWWWMIYVAFIIFGIVIFCYKEFDTKRAEMIALMVTVFGIFLAVSDEFCSQYDYEPYKIIKATWNDLWNDNKIYITDLAKNDSARSNIFFVVDVSQSTEKAIITIDNNKRNELNVLISKINNSAYSANLTSLNENTIKLSELLRIHLYSILIDLQNSKSKFSIIEFDKFPNFLTIDENFTDKDLQTAFNSIKTINFKGQETNFKTLFDFIEKKIDEKDNPFQKDKNTLVFLSDFIHESTNPQDNNADSINAILNRLDKKSIHFNMVGISNIKKPVSFISIKEKIEEILPERYKTIDAINETTIKLELSHHSCEVPLHFYSKNRLHEESAQCDLIFSNTSYKDYRFRLKNNHNARQFYQIVCGTDATKLTEYPISKTITSENKISILMKGHIVSQHFTPVLFIEDLTNKNSFSIGIVFYKELSKSSKILSSLLLGMVFCFSFREGIKKQWRNVTIFLSKKVEVKLNMIESASQPG